MAGLVHPPPDHRLVSHALPLQSSCAAVPAAQLGRAPRTAHLLLSLAAGLGSEGGGVLVGDESGRPGLGWTSLLFLKTSAVMKSKTLRAIKKGLLKATYNYTLVQRAISLKR